MVVVAKRLSEGNAAAVVLRRGKPNRHVASDGRADIHRGRNRSGLNLHHGRRVGRPAGWAADVLP